MSRVSLIRGILIIFCISYALAHGDEERPTKKVKSTLKDRTVELIVFEMSQIIVEQGKEKLDYEIKDNQVVKIIQNDYCKWNLQFYNKSNYWSFVCDKGSELEGFQKDELNLLFGKGSKINKIVEMKFDKVGNKIVDFKLKKPEEKQYIYEHSKLRNSCYKVDIYPPEMDFQAFEIKFCVDKSKEEVVDKYRIILEDKQLGKKIFE